MLNPIKRQQRGVTITDLMIGITVSLLVMAGVAKLFSDYVQSNRGTLRMARLNQELLAATDLIARDLRRGGYWQNATTGVWSRANPTVVANPYAGITVTGSNQMAYNYALDSDNTVGASEAFGFKLDSADGSLKMLKDNAWESLTDPNTTEITSFSITPQVSSVSLAAYCIYPLGSAPEPVIAIRRYDIAIAGRLRADNSVTRQINESVRVRNDQLSNACPTS